ncbi:MAG: AraC family transcriptional regulator [bacterium]
MNKRTQKFKERICVHAGARGEFEPPLRISAAIVSRWGPEDNFTRQDRPNVSLSLVTFGNAIFEQDGRRGVAERGTLFIAHKGSSQLFQTGSEGVLHKRSLILEGAAMDAILISLRLTGIDSVKPRNLPLTMSLFRRANHCLAEKKTGFLREASRLAWDILISCGEGLSEDCPESLRQAMDFVQTSVHRPVHLQEIARASGLSVRHCTRLFQEHTGFSPIQYCIQQRMIMAENLVVNTGEPFKQIAASLGYEDALHFSVQFKHHFKMSPRHYREQARGG